MRLLVGIIMFLFLSGTISAQAVSNTMIPNTLLNFTPSISSTVPVNTMNLSIIINGARYDNAGTYYLPIAIVNGSIGLTNQKSEILHIEVKENSIGRGSSTLNISNNGNIITINTAYFDTVYNVNFTIGNPFSFQADSSGNANASAIDPILVIPPNILKYNAMTIINYQHNALQPNGLIIVGTSNSISSTVTGFNANTYNSFYNANTNNFEFFFYNGTIIPSWLIGNILNGMQNNGLNQSSTLAYFLSYNWNSGFLPANTNGATTNTIYFGWSAKNTILMDGIHTGAAPNLFGVNSPELFYGQYDNGNILFPVAANEFYDNFSGQSLKPIWSAASGAQNLAVVSNGITLAVANGIVETATNSLTSANDVYFALGSSTGNSDSNGVDYFVLFSGNKGAVGQAAPISEIAGNPQVSYTCRVVGGGQLTPMATTTSGQNIIFNFYGNNIANNCNVNFGAFNSQLIGYSPVTGGILQLGSADTNHPNARFQWVLAAKAPPNDIYPATVPVAPTVNTLSSLTFTVSNNPIQINNYQVLTATVFNGISPYTYNFLVYNPTGTLSFNFVYNSVSSTTNTAIFQQIANAGTWTANVIVTDSQTPNNAQLTGSITYTVTQTTGNVFCSGNIVSFSPTNAIVYTNNDPINTLLFYTTSNIFQSWNIIIAENGINVYNGLPFNEGVFNYLPPTYNISFTYSNAPTIYKQCISDTDFQYTAGNGIAISSTNVISANIAVNGNLFFNSGTALDANTPSSGSTNNFTFYIQNMLDGIIPAIIGLGFLGLFLFGQWQRYQSKKKAEEEGSHWDDEGWIMNGLYLALALSLFWVAMSINFTLNTATTSGGTTTFSYGVDTQSTFIGIYFGYILIAYWFVYILLSAIALYRRFRL